MRGGRVADIPEIGPLVAHYGLVNLVETGTGPESSALAAAQKNGLCGYSCDVFDRCVSHARETYPAFRVEHKNSVDFLAELLPDLDGPTLFWLDGHLPTSSLCIPGGIFPLYEELWLIRTLKHGFEKDVIWCDDVPYITALDNPIRAHTVNLELPSGFWHGEKAHAWGEYLAIFADTHEVRLVESVLEFIPR